MRCIIVGMAIFLLGSFAMAAAIETGQELPLPGTRMQATPAAASGRDCYLAVWRDGWHGKGGRARIMAMRIVPDGRFLDPAPIELPASTGVQERPRIAFNGKSFLVVWQDLRSGKDYDILGARVGPNGKLTDGEPIVIAAGNANQVLPDVASDGMGFLVVWQSLDPAETQYRGLAAPISAEGIVGATVETGLTPQPKLAWTGTRYLAAAGENGTFAGSVRTLFLAADGKPQGKPAYAVRGTKAAAFCISPAGAGQCLVVSHRAPPDPWGWGGPGAMRVALVNETGQPVNEDAVKEPSGVQQRLPGWLDIGRARTAGATWPFGPSAAAFDGKHVIVVWPRHHLCGEKMTNFENADLIAARVEDFRSLDPDGIPVAASPQDERNPALASDGKGGLMLLFEKMMADGATRVIARALRTTP